MPRTLVLAAYVALDGPAPTAKIAYGERHRSNAELFVLAGAVPFPVAVLVRAANENIAQLKK